MKRFVRPGAFLLLAALLFCLSGCYSGNIDQYFSLPMASVWILKYRLRLGENGAHVGHFFAERERDGLAVVGEPVGFAALAPAQQIGEQER